MASTGPLSASPSATGLLSLPTEVLSLITLFSDKSTAIALTRVSPHLSSIDIDQHLWPNPQLLSTEQEPTKSSERYYAASAEIGQRYADHIRAILKRADTRRRGMIRSIEVTPRSEALSGLIKLLRVASPTLETLVFEPPNYPPWTDMSRRPDHNDRFERKLFKAGLSFPSLHTLTVGQFISVCIGDTPGIALYLCGTAPRLQNLTINFLDKPYDYGPDHPYLPPYPLPREHPSVLNVFLRVKREDGDLGQALHDLTDLIPYLPSVRRVSVEYRIEIPDPAASESDEGYDEEPGLDSVLELASFLVELGRLKHLEDLDWREIEPWDFWGASAAGSFASLRRLVLGPADWHDIFAIMQPMPNLEMICFLGTTDRLTTCFDECGPHIASGMEPRFASALRLSPNLQFLHEHDGDLDGFNDFDTGSFDFEELEDLVVDCGCSSSEILSFRHGGEEVLRLFFKHAPSPWDGALFTDYRGKVVPVKVLEEMREVEVLRHCDMERGTEVGEEAWAVLTRWYDRAMAEETEETEETEGGE